MPRRTIGLLVTLALGLLAVSLAADGQPLGKISRVGVLSPQHSTESPIVQREPFAQGLRALGWEPGTSLLIEHRYAEGEVDRLPALAAESVAMSTSNCRMLKLDDTKDWRKRSGISAP